MIAKCVVCGKEYQLENGENPIDFQCACGGNLVRPQKRKPMKSVSTFKDRSDGSKSKTKDKDTSKSYQKDVKKFKSFMDRINKAINPLALVIGLAVSIVVLILVSFIFGALLVITGIDSIMFYGTITLVTMTLIGSIVTSFLGSQHLDEGVINGTLLSTLLLIGMGLIVGFVLFIVIGLITSFLASFSSFAPSGASSTTSPGDSLTSWMNIIYGIVGIILTFIAGAGGGALGVMIKEKLEIPL